MAKQLNVDLRVNADVKQAKAAFEDLQKTLIKIQSSALTNSKNLFNVQEIKAASDAARELQQHLVKATDANTGKLNLSTFSNSLKSSGKTLDQYKTQLESLGPEGQLAFTKIAKSIATADNPLRRTNSLLREFSTTLKNTAKWQISSSILHGFMGAIQSAYGYAQDLNESLNNIRIVTGQSVDQMVKFAETANRAAKELSTTTTAYTDAALIYYQQGLSDEAVKRRTDATVKMANVSRQSAEEVSSQMTAIWNNFAKGSENLEYYADVITALGAATAASSEEISQGLEKFAAVADTVGLSYEKATAALATVVAETRQSADVVGTAFRTMFARFQGLKLGESLEDGVDLNKYSSALAAVGVNILEANGQLKDMDTILDELGEKWQNISNTQQVALAETVAGTRQYAQLMALMNNYDKVLSNQDLAANSGGTLQRQADIYAQSWEAASKRVRASMETIYRALLNDEFFIGLNNGFATLLDGVNSFIKGLGGIKGLLSTVGAFITQQLAKEAPAALSRISDYITQIVGKARKNGVGLQSDVQNWAHNEAISAQAEFEGGQTSKSAEYMVEVNMIEMLAEKKRQYNQNEAQYSQEEKQRAQDEIAGLEATGEALQKKAQALDKLREKADQTRNALIDRNGAATDQLFRFQDIKIANSQLSTLSNQLNKLKDEYKQGNISQEEYKNQLNRIGEQASKVGDVIGGEFANRLKQTTESMKDGVRNADSLAQYLTDKFSIGLRDSQQEIDNLKNELSTEFNIPRSSLDDFEQTLKDIGIEAENIPAVLAGVKKAFNGLQGHVSQTSEQIMLLSSAIMQMNTLFNSIQRIKDVFNDEDATVLEKISAILGGLTTLVFTYISANKVLQSVMSAGDGTLLSFLKNLVLKKVATQADTVATQAQTGAEIARTAATNAANTSLATTLAMTGLIAAAVAALVGIIWGLVAVFKEMKDASPEEQLKKAAEASEELKEKANNAKQAADNLRSSFDKYNSVVEKLKECEKGTREWEQALKDVNDTVLGIISDNPALLKILNISRGEDGNLQITNFEQVLSDYENRSRLASINSIGSSTLMSGVNFAYQRNNFYDKYKGNTSQDNVLRDISLNPAQYLNATTEEWQKLQNKLGMLSDDNVFNQLKQDLINLGKSANDTAQNLQNANKLILQESIGDILDKEFHNSDIVSAIINGAASNSQTAMSSIYANVMNQGRFGASQATTQNASSLALAERYLKAIGEFETGKYTADTNLVRGSDANRKYAFRNNNTGEIEEIPLQEMAQAIAAAEASTFLEETAQEFANKFRDIENSQGRNLIASMINNEGSATSAFGRYSKNDLGSILNSGDIIGSIGLSSAEIKEWADYFRISEEEFLEKIQNDIQTVYDNYDQYYQNDFDLEQFRKSYSEGNKIASKLNRGDTISAEDFAKLNEEAQQYFTLMADGTYELTADAEKFYNAFQFSERQQLIDDIIKRRADGADASQDMSALYGTASSWSDLSEIQNQLGFDNTEYIEQYTQAAQRISDSTILAATSLVEFNSAVQQASENGVDVSLETLSTALISIGQQYDSCSKEVSDFEKALATGSQALIEHASAALKDSINIAEMSKALGLNAESVEEQAKSLDDAGKAAKTVAILNQSMNKGLADLNKNWKDWKKNLDKANRGTQDYADAAVELKTTLAQLLGVTDKDFIPEGFLDIPGVMENIEKAANGDVKAINELGLTMAQATIQGMELVSTSENFNMSIALFETSKETVLNGITELMSAIEEGNLKAGDSIDSVLGDMTEGWINGLNNMAYATNMSVEEMNSFLNELGVQTDVTTTTKEITSRVPVYHTVQTATGDYMSGNFETLTKTNIDHYEDMPGEIEVAQINTGDDVGTPPSVTYAGRASAAPSSLGGGKSGGGGGGSSPKHSAETHVDEEHRYDSLNKELDGLSKQYQRLEKAKDRAYGGNKLAIMEKEIALLKRMQATYEKYLKTIAGDNWKELHDTLQNGGNVGALISSGKAGGNLQRDFNKLTRAVEKAIEYIKKDKDGNETLQQVDWKGLRETIGVDIMLDEFGNIANKDEIEEAIEAWWNHAYVDWWNGLSASDQELEVNKEQKDILTAIKNYMEQLLEQYEQSIEDFTEYSDSYMDNLYELQSKVYEEFRYKLDLKVEISERSLKRLEYAIKVLGDNIYKIPEVMRSWFDKRVNQTLAEVQNLGNTWIGGFQEASALHSSGQISDEDYAQLIKDAQDGLYECIDKLLEINEEMREYYKNVLSHVQEEMAHITDEMDHQLNTLTHLTNVLSLLGRETDYDAIQVILNGQMQMTRNAYEVSKAQTEMYRRQVEEAEATLRSLTGTVSREALEEWKNAVLYPAQEALRAAEEEMQQDFEAYLEVLNAIYENRINKIYQESERRLAGAWGNFDEVNRALERQRALDEEYLTKTNQIYETNVLLRKIAQDIDKVNNQSAKLQLKNFADEIEALQQKNKLNKTDLEIAKARYAILQAQIALEDAQNAKSTVRLQRDNEGNFGYVYTADETKIAEAEENLEKANNDLYNLVLEQANSYTEKIIQITQERNAALQQLDMDYKEGRIKDEETYNKLRQDIVDKYNSLLEASYHSYYTAIGWLDEVATTDHTEAWCTSFEDILDAGSDFQAETDRLMEETGAMIDWLNAVRAEATEEAKVGAGELERQVQSLTAANNDLANQMIHDVVPAMEEVLRTAQELTEEWVRQYDAIMALIDSYLQMIDAMNEALANMANAEPADLSEGLGYDPNFDYANAMRNYLAAGGSREDEQYKQWQIERELKINGMGLSEDYYGYRGQELEDAIDTYLNNGLTGYSIKDAVEDFKSKQEENLQALGDNTGATQDNTGAIETNSNAQEDAAEASRTLVADLPHTLSSGPVAEVENSIKTFDASIENHVDTFGQLSQEAVDRADASLQQTTDSLTEASENLANDLASTGQETVDGFTDAGIDIVEGNKEAAREAAEAARNSASEVRASGSEVSSAMAGAASAISGAAGTIAAAIGSAQSTGCFEAGTKVIMENNVQKDIETIQIGEKVLAYNEQEKIFNLQVVLDVYIHYGTQVTVNVELSNGVILHMTPGHPILTTDGWKSLDIINSKLEHGVDATLLELDDVVLGYDSVGIVQNITWNYYPEGITVYTLKVAEYHTFIADNMIVHNAKVAMFDSGGYTGSWGSSGKLAMLHEKELVLDANDTQNLLAAVNVIRELNSAIDLRAGVSGLASSISMLSPNGGNSTLDQNVTIHAEFPNATDHNEIEEAFKTLVNRASQFASRT